MDTEDAMPSEEALRLAATLQDIIWDNRPIDAEAGEAISRALGEPIHSLFEAGNAVALAHNLIARSVAADAPYGSPIVYGIAARDLLAKAIPVLGLAMAEFNVPLLITRASSTPSLPN